MSHEAPASDPLNLFSELRSEVPIFAVLSNRYILVSLSDPDILNTLTLAQQPQVSLSYYTRWRQNYIFVYYNLYAFREETRKNVLQSEWRKHSPNLMYSRFIRDFHLDFVLSFPNISSSPDFYAEILDCLISIIKTRRTVFNRGC